MSHPLGRAPRRLLRTAMLGLLAPVAPLARLAHGRRLGVLAYHDPEPQVLDAHLTALARRYSLVPLPDALEALAGGRDLPPRALAVTFDDGRAGNAPLASVCRAHGLRPTFFVCTRVDGRYWWSGVDPFEQRRLKHVTDAERREATAAAAAGPRESLTREQLSALAAEVDLEPHTRTHPVLPRCDDATARDEIAGSKADLEQLLGRACEVFAYPNGDFGERDVALAREAGFRWAVTALPGLNDARTDPMRLRRLVVRDDAPAWEAVVRASGSPGRLQRLVPRRLWSRLQVR